MDRKKHKELITMLIVFFAIVAIIIFIEFVKPFLALNDQFFRELKMYVIIDATKLNEGTKAKLIKIVT